MKKGGKTTRPFSLVEYLSLLYSGSDKQIQGIRCDRLLEVLWMEVHDILQEAVIKTITKKKKCKNVKWLSDKANS